MCKLNKEIFNINAKKIKLNKEILKTDKKIIIIY